MELLSELLDDGLLEDGLLGGLELDGGEPEELGGVELGGDGGCGVVGLLALGQPLSRKQAQVIPASRINDCLFIVLLCLMSFVNSVGIGNILGAHGSHILKPGPKSGCT